MLGGRLKVVTLVFFVLAVSAHAQDLVEKIDVTRVNVDVTVTSRSHPVRGLSRDDFEVLEDGKLQTITNFYAVENAATVEDSEGVVTPARPVAPVVDSRFRRKVFVVVDYVHTTKINRNRALEQLEQFIDDHFTAGEYDWSIATAGMDLRIILPLTSDKALIHSAIEAMRHDARWQASAEEQPVSLNVRLPFDDPAVAKGDPTYMILSFHAVRDAVRAFAGTEGKKVVLLLSGGLSGGYKGLIHQADVGAILGSDAPRKLMTFRDELIHEANASNLNLYVINPEGLDTIEIKGELYWMGHETGGSFFAGNNPAVSLRRFDELSSNFYSLAYRPSHPEDYRYHRLTVRLKNPGSYELQYRDGYGALPIQAQLARTLATPHAATMQASSIPLTFKTGVAREGKDAAMLLPVAITVPLRYLQFVPARTGSEARVFLFISVFDEDGKTLGVQSFATRAHARHDEPTNHGELTHTALIRLNPGTVHTIVVAIHDEITDAVGVLKQRVEF